ncbi:MAG: hypothetical protein ACLQIB_16865 [Isosphaeraceae bacterium]
MSELDSVNAILRALVALNANEGEGELEAGGAERADGTPDAATAVESPDDGEGVTGGESAGAEEAREPVRGQTIVNGVLQDDPPDVAARRCPGRYPDGPGRIPAGVIVEVRERTAEEREAEREAAEAEAERGAERAAIEAEGQTDEERLAKLPLSSKLTGRCLRMYHQDARSYWLLQPEVRRFRHNVVQVLNQIEGRKLVWSRPYEYVLTMPFRAEPPEKWRLCPPRDMGGCGGAGTVPIYGECSKCHGHGYAVR